MIRPIVKRTAEALLVRSGAAWLARLAARHRTVVLAFHNIVPDDAEPAGERSLQLGQRAFARHLDALRQTHEVVPLTSLFEERRRRSPRPRAVITFDDACAGTVTCGVEELTWRGLPATIFVAPAFVGVAPFWWDVLADPATGLLDPAVRERAMQEHRGDTPAVLAWAEGEGLPRQPVPAHACAATEDQLRWAAAHSGITLGSHTWSHPNLTRLEGQVLEEELTRPLAWLRERFPSTIPWLAYPYGLATRATEAAAAAAGYDAAVLAGGGWLFDAHGEARRYAIPRLNVPAGLSRYGFVLRAAHLGAGLG